MTYEMNILRFNMSENRKKQICIFIKDVVLSWFGKGKFPDITELNDSRIKDRNISLIF